MLARYAELTYNCGLHRVSEIYQGSSFNLYRNSDCLLEIYRGATLLDHVDYTSSWPFDNGRSMYLCDDYFTNSDNDSSGNWRMTPDNGSYDYSGLGQTNHATPGAANPNVGCP